MKPIEAIHEAKQLRGRRPRWKSINLPELQYNRVKQAVDRGYARNNDEFVRIWVEVGLILTSLEPLHDALRRMAERSVQEPVPGKPP